MNVFVTGATGVLGKSVIKVLIDAGHRVYALSRSEGNIALIQQLGAEHVSANLFDAQTLAHALKTTDAEAVLHLATKIPPTMRMGQLASWQENDRIRRLGTRNLIDAALSANVRTLIYPSFYFVYPDCGDQWIDAASTPVQSHPIQQATIDAEVEVARFTKEHRRGIVLRLGNLYGPEALSATEQLHLAQKGFVALLGAGNAYLSYIWVEDAARAIVVALDEAPAGIYDIVDDEPVTRDDFVTSLTHSVGKRRLFRIPGSVIRLLSGAAAEMTSRSQRVSNLRFRELTSWKPTVPNMQVGWKLMAQMEDVKK